jgi:hypothetical protein
MAEHDSWPVEAAHTEFQIAFKTPRSLDAAVAATVEATAVASESLREAVGDRVRYLRGRGAPPERVVVAIKRATREALARALPRFGADLGRDTGVDDLTRAVVGQAVTAAVEAYYG